MRFTRYLLVGGCAAGVDLSVFWGLVRFEQWHYGLAGPASFTLATAVNYVLSVRHVFRSGSRHTRGLEIALVYAVSAVGLALNQLALYAAIGLFGVPIVQAKCAATGVVFFWNYYARVKHVFA